MIRIEAQPRNLAKEAQVLERAVALAGERVVVTTKDYWFTGVLDVGTDYLLLDQARFQSRHDVWDHGDPPRFGDPRRLINVRAVLAVRKEGEWAPE